MKRLGLALLFSLLIGSASAQLAGGLMFPGPGMSVAVVSGPMITPVLSAAGSGQVNVSFASFTSMMTGRTAGNWTTVFDNTVQMPWPVAGTITGLSVNFPAGTGVGVWSMGLRQNGALTTLQCVTITATTPATCTDTHSVAIAASDLLNWEACPGVFTAGSCVAGTAPTASGFIQLSALFTSTSNNESFVGSAGSGTPSTSVANYSGFGGNTGFSTTEAAVSSLISAPGVLDNITVHTATAPGAGNTYTVSLFYDGASVGISCPVKDTNKICNFSTSGATNTPLTVAAGHTISFEICPGTNAGSGASCVASGIPTAGNYTGSLRFVPTNAGEANIFETQTVADITANGSTNFNYLEGSSNSNNGTETIVCNVAPVLGTTMTIKNLAVKQSTAPGGAATKTFVLRTGTCASQSSATPGCVIASGATTCSDTNSATLTSSQFANWRTTATGTGNNAAVTWSKRSVTVTVP